MYLKSLDINGFKSFAEKTTIQLSDEVNVIVGPNGSGKSNVVDAISVSYTHLTLPTICSV